jgi:hypothetical protein
VILCEWHLEDLLKVWKPEQFFLGPWSYKVELDDLFGRTQFMTFFVKDFLKNHQYFKMHSHELIYSVDQTRKQIHLNYELSAAYSMCLEKKKNIIFGAPPLGLLLEDLALNLSLEELQGIFEQTRRTLAETYNSRNSLPYGDPVNILNHFRLTAFEEFPDKLYGKRLAFNSSIADLTSYNFSKVMVMSQAPVIEKIKMLK